MTVRPLLVATTALFVLGAGCHRSTIESYRVPKEKDPEMPMANTAPAAPGAGGAGGMAATAVPTAEGAGLTWTAPSSWKPQAASAMRKGSFAVPGKGGPDADLSITAFPGDVGGELANVNRWRGQVQQPPIAEPDLATNVQRIEANGLKFGVVDVAGTGPNADRILGALVPYNGATWFFKLKGVDAVVEGAKPDFLAFLQTVKPASPAAQ